MTSGWCVCPAPVPCEENYPSTEELIAKARAPVKREYVIFNTGPRVMAKSVVGAKASDDKKSKRQLRRERQEVRRIFTLLCETLELCFGNC